MERKVDAIEAFQLGYQEGQEQLMKLIVEYCNINAKNIQQLIQAINAKVNHAA